jgi:hypothetical protein
MQHPMAQIVALVLYGNHFLRTGNTLTFYPDNSTFRFCNSVSFVQPKYIWLKPHEIPYADDPLEWFQKLRDERVKGLRLHHISDNRWLVETLESVTSAYWEARWQPTPRATPNETKTDDRIWSVTYRMLPSRVRPRSFEVADLSRMVSGFSDVLRRIRAFAEQHDLTPWTEYFDRGEMALRSTDPLSTVYHSDLVPAGDLTIDARRLLAAAQAAWVFGGMGWWNDMSFEGEEGSVYNSLSRELYDLLNHIVVAATNTGYGVTSP